MRKAFLVLLMVLSLATMLYAQSDVGRTNLQEGGIPGDLTYGNSQYIYIRVTMAGIIFSVSNEDWIIGRAAGANPWYAYPKNTYLSAEGSSYRGEYPLSYVPNTGAYLGTFGVHAAGYIAGEPANNGDCPIIQNQGGVALDFFLGVASVGGWKYDSRHISNRVTDLEARTTDAFVGPILGQPVFQNAFQLRAIFLRVDGAANTTGAYGAGNAAKFLFPPQMNLTAPYAAAWSLVPPVSMANVDLVLTTMAFETWGVHTTAGVGDAATGRAWSEATTMRFNPERTDVNFANQLPYTATAKGLGIPPDGKVTIAMALLTPRVVTPAFSSFGGVRKIIKLKVYGTASDAN